MYYQTVESESIFAIGNKWGGICGKQPIMLSLLIQSLFKAYALVFVFLLINYVNEIFTILDAWMERKNSNRRMCKMCLLVTCIYTCHLGI